ncbi:hypothetical protein HYX19_04145 [Candidatus Woesearchaeota archaeon]|nr:hypothetical protein [Candidatus Woesearchaeota archaeon]
MPEFEKYQGLINGTPNLNGKRIEIEGICAGVLYRSHFLGLLAIYHGTLVKENEHLQFSGRGSFGSTDGDVEASLAKLSEARNVSAFIQGRLYLSNNVGDPVHYSIEISGIKVGDMKSLYYQ